MKLFLQTLVHTNLVSRRVEERIDAAKVNNMNSYWLVLSFHACLEGSIIVKLIIFQHLGLLRCGDTMVFYALKEKMRMDDDERVRYEAAKSLILVGK